MNKPEQNTSNRAQRMKRAGLVLLGTAATATLLGGDMPTKMPILTK